MISVILSVLAKPKKLLNTFMVTGFESVETGNRIVTPLSYIVDAFLCFFCYTVRPETKIL